MLYDYPIFSKDIESEDRYRVRIIDVNPTKTSPDFSEPAVWQTSDEGIVACGFSRTHAATVTTKGELNIHHLFHPQP